MKLPKNITEEEFLQTFDRVVGRLAKKFRFGIHLEEDIRQEAMLEAIKGINNGYTEGRPLANFLYTHLHNRLYNFKRNNYVRLEKPCSYCPIKAFLPPEGCSAYEDRMECALFANWTNKNTFKKNLTHTIEFNLVSDKGNNIGYSNELTSDINTKEILELIDKQLSLTLRKPYLKMIAGDKVSKKDRLDVEAAILEILKEHKYELG
jgi:hypothetical protein